MDNLFVGNIVRRVFYETRSNAWTMKIRGKIYSLIEKENAILYKTQNGGYVDIEDLNKKRDYKSVEKVVLEYVTYGAEYSKRGILVMPAASFSEAKEEYEKHKGSGTLGIFVDSDSLRPYNSDKNIEETEKTKTYKKNKF